MSTLIIRQDQLHHALATAVDYTGTDKLHPVLCNVRVGA